MSADAKQEDLIRRHILGFLATSAFISRINFTLRRYQITPQCYREDIAGAIRREDIEIAFDAEMQTKGIGGRYRSRFLIFVDDTLTLPPSFSISVGDDQATLVHELTHAVLDHQNLGKHSGHEDEAVAYVAEAIFRMEAQLRDSPHFPQAKAIASQVLADSSQHLVRNDEAYLLVRAIANHPTYRNVLTMPSDGT